MRIGVFVCHCGLNIAGTVDVKKVAEEAARKGHVTFSLDYKYMCSEPGQAIVIDAIKKNKLDKIVIAACSPRLHERTFQKCIEKAGLNPYLVEMANIREQCSWVHSEMSKATPKAVDIVGQTVSKVKKNKSLTRMKIPVTKKVLIIGGGIAGIQAAIDISSAGYEVAIVEKENKLGGNLVNYKKTFPNFGDVKNFLSDIIASLNDKVKIHLNSEVENVGGYIGNFFVRIRKKNEIFEEKFGAVIVATGFTNNIPARFLEHKNIITNLDYEKLVKNGKVLRPSDNKEAKTIVFIQCIDEDGLSYCSRICCMTTAKQAKEFKELNPNGEVYIFYNDIIAPGKGYEEFIEKVQNDEGVLYIRSGMPEIKTHGDSLIVKGVDLFSQTGIEIKPDMIVVVPSLVANTDAVKVAQIVGIPYDKNKFFSEVHMKLAPVETVSGGIFLAGACQSPKDITDTLISASASASKVLSLFSEDLYAIEPIVAVVNERTCNGCFDCKGVCTFNAIEETTTRDGRKVAKVIESMCHGCGNCTSACRPGSIDLAGFTNEQIMMQLDSYILEKT